MWCKIKELVLRKPKNVVHENIEYKENTQRILNNWGIIGIILLKYVNRSLMTGIFPSN